MCNDLNFVKVKAHNGIHYIRKHLIVSISQCEDKVYAHFEHLVDAKTKLLYHNGELFYFTDEIETVIESLKGEW